MTQKEEIWQRALSYSETNPEDYVRGAQWMYEKMMKCVTTGYIRRNKHTKVNVLNGLDTTCDELQQFRDKDRLKIIFIKDE